MKFKLNRLFQKTLVAMVLLFGAIALLTSCFSGWNLYRHLYAEYENKGIAIAKSLSDAGAELIMGGDGALTQSIVNQYFDMKGVVYIILRSENGKVLFHSFGSHVPSEFQTLHDAVMQQRLVGVYSRNITLATVGSVIDITAPVHSVHGGFVHVGMDKSSIEKIGWDAFINQQGIVMVIFLLSIMVSYLLIRRIAQPLTVLTIYAKRLAKHDFLSVLPNQHHIRSLAKTSEDEVGNLANAFIFLESQIGRYIRDIKDTTAAKEKIESELAVARHIQMSLVPQSFPVLEGRHDLDLFAIMQPAKAVGGDFYDFKIENERLHVVIGDVSGKGVPASLLMAITMTMVRANISPTRGSAEVLRRVNDQLCTENTSGLFVTISYGILDLKTGVFEYCSGGHHPPYWLHEGEATELQITGGMALGLASDCDYEECMMTLKKGDGIFFYTDGITEARNRKGEFFREERLEGILRKTDMHAQNICDAVVDEVTTFAGTAPQSDDLTVTCIIWDPEGNRG
jgi:sigma-B regulation protein RsbU (phosphoserine phosphatase)